MLGWSEELLSRVWHALTVIPRFLTRPCARSHNVFRCLKIFSSVLKRNPNRKYSYNFGSNQKCPSGQSLEVFNVHFLLHMGAYGKCVGK